MNKPISTLTLLMLFPLTVRASAQDVREDDAPTPASATGIQPSLITPQLAVTADKNHVIFSTIPGHPTALVPGLGPAQFTPSSTSAFDRVYGSPNGNWIISADTDLATTEDEVLIVNGIVVARQGTQAPWGVVGENTDTIDTKLGINDAGQYVAAINTTATANDDYIVMGDAGSTWTILAQEGALTNLVSLPGTTWDDILESPCIDKNGAAGWSGDGIDGGGITTTTDDILVLGGVLLLQEGVTIPGGQLGAEFIENFDLSDYFVSANGLHWLVQGDLTGSTTTDQVLIVDGAVVLQEGVVVPGSGYVDPVDTSGIVGCFMDGGGNWYARGNNDITEQDWIVRNGVVIAETGASIDGSSAELWSDALFGDCFFLHTGNSVGDYIVAGVTDNPDPLRDAVMIKNGTEEIVRQGDPIDLDGNGIYDDNVFFNVFNNDDIYLADNGDLYFTATMMDGAAASLGQGLFLIETGELGTAFCFGTTCPCGNVDPGGTGGCSNSLSLAAVLTASGTASASNSTLVLEGVGMPNTPGLYFQGNNQAGGGAGTFLGDGLLCAQGGITRLQIVFTSGNTSQSSINLATAGGVQSGDTRIYQLWYRDPVGPCGGGFNLSNGYELTWGL